MDLAAPRARCLHVAHLLCSVLGVLAGSRERSYWAVEHEAADLSDRWLWLRGTGVAAYLFLQ